MKTRTKSRTHPLDLVLIGVMLGICGLVILEIVEWIRWLLSI